MEVDMSLDDIIKKKKISGKPKKPLASKKNGLQLKTKGGGGIRKAKQTQVKAPIIDARLKIIQKNRSKIRDARDKLSEIARKSDARLKLRRKPEPAPRPMSMKGGRQGRQGFPKMRNPPNNRGFGGLETSPLYIGAPRGYVDHDRIESDEITFPVEAHLLKRTVSNNLAFQGTGNTHDWDMNADPFDLYEPPRRTEPPRPGHSQWPESPRKGILRRTALDSPPRIIERRFIPDENSHLSYEMRSRLERAPDPRASVGIFSRGEPAPSPPLATDGYRIVVSNLHHSVTENDIVELFEDIGQLMEARLVRPGVAEVVFKGLKDAEQAVDTYHNRQLDGLPMKCLLVNNKAVGALKRPTLSRSTSKQSKDPLEIDIDALHSVLFRR
ncbi:uncharacterized protein DMENIID0001_107680 [Sergentomyia squamirostris]